MFMLMFSILIHMPGKSNLSQLRKFQPFMRSQLPLACISRGASHGSERSAVVQFDYYGSVERYDQYVKSRPSCYIDTTHRGSEIAGEAAAALAAAAMAFKENNVKR